ncbi:hypothetical protein [Psychrobacillus sp. L3]
MANFQHFRKLAMQNNQNLRGMMTSRFNKEWTQEELAFKVGISLDNN